MRRSGRGNIDRRFKGEVVFIRGCRNALYACSLLLSRIVMNSTIKVYHVLEGPT